MTTSSEDFWEEATPEERHRIFENVKGTYVADSIIYRISQNSENRRMDLYADQIRREYLLGSYGHDFRVGEWRLLLNKDRVIWRNVANTSLQNAKDLGVALK